MRSVSLQIIPELQTFWVRHAGSSSLILTSVNSIPQKEGKLCLPWPKGKCLFQNGLNSYLPLKAAELPGMGSKRYSCDKASCSMCQAFTFQEIFIPLTVRELPLGFVSRDIYTLAVVAWSHSEAELITDFPPCTSPGSQQLTAAHGRPFFTDAECWPASWW